MNPKETLTARLQRELKARESAQSIIARETGVAQATISRIITGKSSPRLATAERLMSWLEANKKASRRRKKTTEPAETAAQGA